MKTEAKHIESNVDVFKGLPFEDYLKIDAINHSVLSAYSQGSYQAKHKLDNAKAPSPAQKLGTADHDIVLYGLKHYLNKYLVHQKVDRRTKDGKTYWSEINAAAEKEKKTLISEDDHLKVYQTYQSVWSHEDVKHLLEGALKEYTIVWNDEQTGIRLKARLDVLNTELSVIADLKTSNKIRWHDLQTSLYSFNYWTQLAHYLRAAKAAGFDVEHAIIIFVQSDAPHECCPIKVDDELIEIGNRQLDLWLKNHLECTEKNKWPSEYDTIRTMSVPDWAMGKLRETHK